MLASTVWGLDIGNSAIKAVKMTKVGNACKIIEFDIVDIPPGDDDKDRVARLEVALGELTKNHKFGSDPVVLAFTTGFTGNMCLYREFQLPPGSEDKLTDLVLYEAKQQIPFPLDQVYWGYERYDDPSGIGVGLIAVRRNDIQELLALTDRFKLNVRAISPGPMALYNFIHYEFNPQNTTLILDAGAKGTDFVVMNKRQIYFRTIQIAGREITRVLENKFKVPFEKAEDLKKNIAQSPQMEKILTVIEPTLRQLGAEVQRTIGFYKSKARGQRIYQCYLLGHTFRLPKMADYLQTQVREAPFAIVEGLQRVKLDPSCNGDVWANEFPTMAVAMGLGLQGLGVSELTLNLLPPERQADIAALKWKAWSTMAAAVVIFTVGFSYFQASAMLETYKGKLDSLKEAETKVTRYQAEEQKLVSNVPERKQMLERMARVGHDRGKLAQIVTAVSNLKMADGKAFFSPENKTFLTGLYASRMPLKEDALSNKDRENLKSHESLNSFYAFLNGAPDHTTLPPETRPDAPLMVILSGETEANVNKVLGDLETALDKVEQTEHRAISSQGVTAVTETPLMFKWDGKRSEKTPPADANKPEAKYAQFHMIVRWQDKNDPDIGFVAAPKKEAAKK